MSKLKWYVEVGLDKNWWQHDKWNSECLIVVCRNGSFCEYVLVCSNFPIFLSMSGWTTVNTQAWGQVMSQLLIWCRYPEDVTQPVQAKLPSTATLLLQYSSDQTFSLSLSVSVSARHSAPSRFAIWYVMLHCVSEVQSHFTLLTGNCCSSLNSAV